MRCRRDRDPPRLRRDPPRLRRHLPRLRRDLPRYSLLRFQGAKTRVRLTDVRRSFALGEPVAPATALDKSEPI